MRTRSVDGPAPRALAACALSLTAAALLLLAASPAFGARRPLPIPPRPTPTPSADATPTPTPTATPTRTPTATPTGGVEPEPATPAAGLVFDGVLAVRVLTSDLLPLVGADVTLQAFPATGAAFAAHAVTNDTGTATLTHLPRTVDGPPLVWIVNVRGTVTTVEGECTTTSRYRGSIDVIAQGGARAVPIVTDQVGTSEACAAQATPRSGGTFRTAAPAHSSRPRAGGGVSGGSVTRNPTLTPPATTTDPGERTDGSPIALLVVGFGLVSASALLTLPRRR